MTTKHTPTPWTLTEGQCFANTICLDVANRRPVSLNLAQAARDAIEFAADRERKLVEALRGARDALSRIATSASKLTAEYAGFEADKIGAALDKVQS